MSHFSNCLVDIYTNNNIISEVFPSIYTTQYEGNYLIGITIRHFAALDFLLNHTLIRDVSSIITVSAFGCSYFVFVPCSRMSCSCDFTAECSMSFCDTDGGQF